MIRQKNFVLAVTVMAALILGGYLGFRWEANGEKSDLLLANVEALSWTESSPSNTGPSDTFDCKKCGVTVKICESKNFHPCTPDLCGCYK